MYNARIISYLFFILFVLNININATEEILSHEEVKGNIRIFLNEYLGIVLDNKVEISLKNIDVIVKRIFGPKAYYMVTVDGIKMVVDKNGKEVYDFKNSNIGKKRVQEKNGKSITELESFDRIKKLLQFYKLPGICLSIRLK